MWLNGYMQNATVQTEGKFAVRWITFSTRTHITATGKVQIGVYHLEYISRFTITCWPHRK